MTTTPRRRGRKLTTGRFNTREELVDWIWRDWLRPGRTQAMVARSAGVSEGTVLKILNTTNPPKDKK